MKAKAGRGINLVATCISDDAFMFIKMAKSGKYEYAQIVRAYRENGVVKKVLLSLG